MWKGSSGGKLGVILRHEALQWKGRPGYSTTLHGKGAS